MTGGRSRFLLAATIGLLAAAPRASAQAAPLSWQLEVIPLPQRASGCTPGLWADSLRIHRPSRGVFAAWREAGCPFGPGESVLRWARRDAQSPEWAAHSIVDQGCSSLLCPGLRGDPPAFALRPDGNPFYVYGLLGPFETYYVARADLGLLPGGPGALTPEALAQYQSTASYPMFAADFAASAADTAVPNHVRASSGGPLTLNGTPIEYPGVSLLAYANGPAGQHHVVFHGSLGAGNRYYYSNGTPGAARAILEPSSSQGIHLAVDVSNRVHLVVAGAPEDFNWFWSRLLYLTSDDGVSWTRTELDAGLDAGHSNRNPAIAIDSQGNPAVAYWRYPDQIRMTRFDGAAWHDGLVTTTGSATGAPTAPRIAFDDQDQPVVFLHHEGTSALMLATGQTASSDGVVAASVSGAGSGSIASSPAGIACPGACSAAFARDSYVTLQATPNAGSSFVGWAGVCSGIGPCIVKVGEALSVGAVFGARPDRNEILVTATSQDGGSADCTLGDAIRAANTDAAVNGCPAGSGPDTIVLPAGVYPLGAASGFGTGLPLITSDVLIQGAGASQTIIERLSTAPAFRILYVVAPARFALNGVTIRGGGAEGAGLYMSAGPVEISDSSFADNDASAYGNGGAISNPNGGRLVIDRTSFTGNRASSGGAVSSAGGLTISDSTFASNAAPGNGGALYLTGTTVIVNSRFLGNTATASAAGIYNGGSLIVTSSKFEANVLHSIVGGAGGALHNEGTLTLVDSTLSNNQANAAPGGAVGNAGAATIVGSTFTQNQASGDGGALWSYGSQASRLEITNSTISGNRSGRRGGGIALFGYGSLALSSVTIADNEVSTAFGPGPSYGGGFFQGGAATVSMRNTILARNSDSGGSYPGVYPDCLADTPVTSLGYNLFGDAQNCGVAFQPSDRTGGPGVPLDPMLGPLQDNGGPTPTHALLTGSPAIDTANPAEPGRSDDACPAADQRGGHRPRGAACDVGAFELVPRFRLDVAKDGEGHGSVSSADGGIDCGSVACAAEYDQDTVVTLAALPDGDSMLDSWTGCDTVTGATCTVGMQAQRLVTARFALKLADLAVSLRAAPDPVVAGKPLLYFYGVTNHGPSVATGVVTTLSLPPGLAVVSHSPECLPVGDTVPCTIADLAVGSTVDLEVEVTAAGDGSLPAAAMATANEADPVAANNALSVSTVLLPATVAVQVDEHVTVSDAVALLPSVMLSVSESIAVHDEPGLLPSVMLNFSEAITVNDEPALLPAAMIGIEERIVVQDAVEVSNTPPGADVFVQPPDSTTGGTPVSLTFASVAEPGTSSLTTGGTGTPPPSGFQLGSPATYFEITTTAAYSGSITVCIDYSGMTFQQSSALRLFHLEAGVWVDRTFSLDASAHVICAVTTSLSPFIVAEPTNRPPSADAGPDQTLEATSPGGAVVTLNGTASTDPDGDTLTYTWTGPFGSLSGATISVTLGLGAHAIGLAVDDGKGATSSDSLVVVVRDTIAPQVAIASPAEVTYAFRQVVPASYSCADGGSGVASCLGPVGSGLPIDTSAEGTQTFAVTATDRAGNVTTKAVTYTVTGIEGRMSGEGQLEAGGFEHRFEFRIAERSIGQERGALRYAVRRTQPNRQRTGSGRFESTSVAPIAFWDEPAARPGRRPRPSADSAVFSGTGTWNGVPGYTFEAVATDAGEPGRGHDTFAITIRDARGETVATISGALTAGNIQSHRLEGRAKPRAGSEAHGEEKR